MRHAFNNTIVIEVLAKIFQKNCSKFAPEYQYFTNKLSIAFSFNFQPDALPSAAGLWGFTVSCPGGGMPCKMFWTSRSRSHLQIKKVLIHSHFFWIFKIWYLNFFLPTKLVFSNQILFIPNIDHLRGTSFLYFHEQLFVNPDTFLLIAAAMLHSAWCAASTTAAHCP